MFRRGIGTQTTSISAVWANDGMDKVTQDERRAFDNPSSVINSVWDGTTITQFGAKNEVVSINLIIEAAHATASNVNVSLSNLSGPGGALIRSDQTRSSANLYNWTTTEAELFYIRYLQIKGIGVFLTGDYYDMDSFMPAKMRGTGGYPRPWTTRPNHDKFYPDIAVPLELQQDFTIVSGNNQSIWADIYIPKTVATGVYTGTITIKESGVTTRTIPVSLTVKNFTLPDVPNAKTMLFFDTFEDGKRYGTSLQAQVAQNNYRITHRHKITLFGYSNGAADQPTAAEIQALDGSLFTAANGYAGPGVSTGLGLYVIGAYHFWANQWGGETQSIIQTHTNNWEAWFQANSPSTERFIYLIDESSNYAQTEQWAGWVKNNPGGNILKTFATLYPVNSVNSVPSLSITASVFSYAMNNWPTNVATIEADPLKDFYLYNGQRAGQGSFQTEDDGIALRANPWIQYKHGIDRWFNYHANLWNVYTQYPPRDVFNVAQTFGGTPSNDTTWGLIVPPAQSGNSANGDGVLFYPGTDIVYPANNYDVAGPFMSLRMKYWRRGIQDVDYIAMAAAINPTAVTTIVNAIVPNVLWETPGIGSSGDFWISGTTVGWNETPDDWEAQRLALANIIEGV